MPPKEEYTVCIRVCGGKECDMKETTVKRLSENIHLLGLVFVN